MTETELLSHFPRRRRNAPGDHHVPCPAHDDNVRDPSKFSLHVSTAGDRILMHCFAGCSTESIVKALGLTEAALFLEEKTTPGPVALPEPVPTLDAFAALKRIPKTLLEGPLGVDAQRLRLLEPSKVGSNHGGVDVPGR
jgi:hypothetical protein